MRLMEPGKSYDIEITLPADHTRGTYWYHPHFHGSADVQVASGMLGAIVVEGDFADVPEIAQARQGSPVRFEWAVQRCRQWLRAIGPWCTRDTGWAARWRAFGSKRRPALGSRSTPRPASCA